MVQDLFYRRDFELFYTKPLSQVTWDGLANGFLEPPLQFQEE